MQGNIWYNVGVPKSSEKKNENFSLKMPDSVMARLKDIAEFEDRPLGYVGRELMLRGLSLYELDGKLRGEAPARRQLAPVVARIERGETIESEDIEWIRTGGGRPRVRTGSGSDRVKPLKQKAKR